MIAQRDEQLDRILQSCWNPNHFEVSVNDWSLSTYKSHTEAER